MASRFCPKCGKKGIKGDFCSECFQEESGLEFKDIECWKCVNCEKYFVKNRWKEFPDDDAGIIETAMNKIKNPKRLSLEIEPVYKIIQNKPGLKNPIEIKVLVEGQEFILPGNVFVKACPNCSKKGTQYFEGVLQIREITPDIENFVKMDLKAAELQGVHVAKSVRKGDSWDIFLTSNKYLRQLGNKLKRSFNGKLTESAKLFTHDKQRSKDLYRLAVMFKPRKYNIGDVVEVRGKKVKIKTLGKRASGVDVETGKKVFVDVD